MRRSTIARAMGCLTAAFGLTIGFTSQASAVYNSQITYTDNVRCVSGSSETSAGSNGGGFSRSWTFGYNRLSNGYCQVADQYTGWLSVERHLLAFNMSTGVWWKCAGYGPARNLSPASGVGLEGNFNRLCGGDVWYATNTAAYGWDGVAWRGNWVVSGNHWVPWAGLAKNTPQPRAPKISAAEAIARGEVRLGSPTGPKAGADQLQAPPRVPGTAPVSPPSVRDGSYRTVTR
ncbi:MULTISPECIES: hypothetical protein [Streptomyces]|uniref:Uncharacterized protein n=1 Tax=Streptomyces katsurahamanus TaxID=2577098 RepID=A0ABW9NLV9_9ACTN|nr:hypothetical protein [Streptomyces katsurahamanus]MQS34238.1 hypothetical protein [Streptomyces katsurahamanus]